MVRNYLSDIGIVVHEKQEAGNALCTCPWCGDEKGLRVALAGEKAGLANCFKCGESGNAWTLARKLRPDWTKAQVVEILKKYNLFEGSAGPAPKQQEKSPVVKEPVRDLSPEELEHFAKIKNIDPESLRKINPRIYASKPVVLIPGYDPADMSKPKAYIKARLDGQVFTSEDGEDAKYLLEKGSAMSLVGLPLALAPESDVLVYAEGWKDALAAISVGLTAIASSNGAPSFDNKWLGHGIFADRLVLVIFDRDKAGVEFAAKHAAQIATVAREVRIVELPYEYTDKHGRDLHDFIREDGHTREEVLALPYVRVKAPKEIDDDYPDTVARQVVSDYAHDLHHNEVDGWSECLDGRHCKITDAELRRLVNIYAPDYWVRKGKTRIRYKISRNKVLDVIDAMKAIPRIHIPRDKAAPCCLDGSDASRLIGMNNGILDVSDPSKPVLRPFDGNFYTFNYLPFDYDPAATAPTWMDSLGTYFRNDAGLPDELVPDILHQWIKKILLRDTSHQKIFALIGRRRSGKSTIGRVIRSLIGSENTVPITISSLTKEFGLQPLLNKSLGIMWDASLGGRSRDTAAAVEVLKSISGEDTFTVNRKNKDMLTDLQLRLNILIIANKILDLRDSTGALAGRFVFLETTGSFYGREDPAVEERIQGELPGILNLVLKAPEGRIMEHPDSETIKEEFENISNPYGAFISDWCTLDEDCFCPCEILYMHYLLWCNKEGINPPRYNKFVAEFRMAADGITRYRPRLSELQIRKMRDEYKVDQLQICLDQNRTKTKQSGPPLELGDRMKCFRGVDVAEDKKGLWTDDGRSTFGSGFGPG